MFSFFRKERIPAGPHTFGAETEIARPVDELFALLDIGQPSYWKRQMGDRVDEVTPGKFEMIVAIVPDAKFFLEVTEYEPGKVIAFDAYSVPLMGRLQRANERYEVTEFEPGMTRLELSMTVHFQSELKMKAFQDEQVMLAVSCFNAVEKIRLFAEQGKDAVHVADGQVVVGFDEIACQTS